MVWSTCVCRSRLLPDAANKDEKVNDRASVFSSLPKLNFLYATRLERNRGREEAGSRSGPGPPLLTRMLPLTLNIKQKAVPLGTGQ
jgi:hypothetical protein